MTNQSSIKWPSLSVIMINRNDSTKMKQSLASLSEQDYPKDLIETLVIDGGSSDNSKEVAKKYGAKFIDGGYSENQEARRAVGTKHAKNEILLFLDTDNYLPYKTWLKDMLQPLIEDLNIFASQPSRYTHRKNDSIFNRYCSLFGVNDPVVFYLGKQDRMAHYDNGWTLKGDAEDKGNYYKVKFTSSNLSTVGCNGFLIRREVLNKVVGDPENFFHIDVIFDLLELGYTNIAFIKNDIIHDTSTTLTNLMKKRMIYLKTHSVELAKRRRYRVYDSNKFKDNLLLVKFLFFTVTLVKPLFDSLRGFVKRPDIAWFVHPVICWIFLYAYGMSVVRKIDLTSKR